MAQNVFSGCSTVAYVKSKILANMYATREAPEHENGQPSHPTNISPSTEGLKGRPSRSDKRGDEVNVIAMDPMRQSNCPMWAGERSYAPKTTAMHGKTIPDKNGFEVYH